MDAIEFKFYGGIFEYTRADAIADGLYVDISKQASATSSLCQVVVTSSLWHLMNTFVGHRRESIQKRCQDAGCAAVEAIGRLVFKRLGSSWRDEPATHREQWVVGRAAIADFLRLIVPKDEGYEIVQEFILLIDDGTVQCCVLLDADGLTIGLPWEFGRA